MLSFALQPCMRALSLGALSKDLVKEEQVHLYRLLYDPSRPKTDELSQLLEKHKSVVVFVYE